MADRISARGLAFLKAEEGLRLRVYRCQANVESIGYGHALTDAEKKAGAFHSGISAADAEALLRRDLEWVETAIVKNVRVAVTQGVFDALCSFVFNVGAEAFRKSTLLRLLNAGKPDEAGRELARWTKGGQPPVDLPVLVRRRAAEQVLWNTPDDAAG